MKLKDGKTCHCPAISLDPEDAQSTLKYCRAGYCTVALCLWCGLERWSAGPIACPCKKNENGTLRWYKYPDMDTKTHVAVKESKNMRKPKRPKRTSGKIR